MAPLNTLLTDSTHAEHVAFWTSVLGTATNDFHFRQPWLSNPAEQGSTFHEDCSISPTTSALVDQLARDTDLGVLVVVVSAVSFLLHTHTRTGVIAVDTPPLAETATDDVMPELIPLVTTVDGTLPVRDYLKQVSEAIAKSYSYHPFPVAQVAEVLLKRPRPATNVVISLQGLHGAALDAEGHALRITISRQPSLAIGIDGRAPAFSSEYLRIFARHLSRILDAYADLSVPLASIDVMGDTERHRLLVEYNATSSADIPATTIHQLFEDQVSRAGSSAAIQLDETTLTYDTLNRRANQLARCLQTEYGVQPGDVIGVVTDRSPLVVAGLLGVLKAGAVYLPLDPDYPEERLQFMVADAAVKVLLVHSGHFDRLAALYETPMFALDIQLDVLESDDGDLGLVCGPADLAYIIYTSGSTGQPKAVLLEHGGFVSMVRHHIDAFGVGASDRLLQFYAQSFDSSLFEIFVSLLSGATLVMASQDTINDPEQLSTYIETQRITTLTLPPVYLGTLSRERLGSVRRFISAGDHCRVEDALRLAQTSDYYNSYGPTETSVCVTHYKVDPRARYGSRIPIGKPITGTSIYLLDDELRPVPEGVVGEICVGGASLARGYLHRDELTAQKFVASPFAAGQRLYLTGDIGVWLPGGNLEVIGRKDTQVKIRGYRVELGEIESVLDQHSLVKEAAVIAPEDDGDHRRLTAYVTSTGPIEAADLKTLLRSRLPEFMIPSAFVMLERMPLTANGKIDRQALPSAVAPTVASDPSAGQPQTPTQDTLARIWREVLSVERVGIHDNLFDLGGDSILVIQIVSRAREVGLKLAPNQLFDHQTVAELAEVAASVQPTAPASAEQTPIEGNAPLTPMQAWFFDQRFADPHHFNQSVYLEAPDDNIDSGAAEAATLALLNHHDALRLRFTESDGSWAADFAPPATDTPFAIIDVSGVAADQREDHLRDAVRISQTSFDLATGPLLRVTLFRFGEGRPSRLLFVAHHLAVDGVSWRILLADFFTAYSQVGRGEPVALPDKTTSYRTWARQLLPLASTLSAAAASAPEGIYWCTDDLGSVGSLPTDHTYVAGVNTVASARNVTRSVDADTTTALLQDVPRAYATEINDVLLTALALTFHAWTGRDHLLLDLEGHGREDLLDDVDTSRTVGWFTSQFPVLLRVGHHDSPGDVIKSVKEQLRALPRRGAEYGLLRYLSDDAQLVERLNTRTKPQILFNYFGQAGRVLAPELQWTLIPGSAGSDTSPRAMRPHLLEVNAMVEDGRLAVTWTFSEAVHRRHTIEDLAERYQETLRQIVDHCRMVTTRQFTPSDFPSAGLDQRSLDALIEKISR